MQKLAHVICLQEHWLFNFEQNLAEKITSNLKFKIKSVDDKNPIPSTQKPRSYAIAWKKDIDHLIDDNIEEGNERIVCIRIKVKPTPILIVSVYMPCRGNRSGDEEYKECLDILFEITRKYHIDHRIILSGDWNCDLTGKVSPRQKKLEAFLQECGYLHKATGHTFTHPNGHDCSTIDYIFLHQQFDKEMTEVIKLDLLPDNTSDHYPLITQLVGSLDIKETMKEKPGFTRTNWEKVDKDEYQQTLKAKLEKISFEQNHEHTDTQTLMDILIEASQEVAPKRTKRKAKHEYLE